MAHYEETQSSHLTGTNKNLYQLNWNAQNWLQLSLLQYFWLFLSSDIFVFFLCGFLITKKAQQSLNIFIQVSLRKKKALILYVLRHLKLSTITYIELSKSTFSCDWLIFSHRFHQQKRFPISSENTVPIERRQTQWLWITQYTKLPLHNSFCSARRDISVSIRFSKHFIYRKEMEKWWISVEYGRRVGNSTTKKREMVWKTHLRKKLH